MIRLRRYSRVYWLLVVDEDEELIISEDDMRSLSASLKEAGF